LRTTLRQDPDVIVVGEIRDGETAKLAIQAALTGHLVISTIHTNDAIGVIPRLIDMGVEPYLIPPVLILSIAQRLTRTLCAGTGEQFEISPSHRASMLAQMESLPEQYRFEIPQYAYNPQKTSECPTGLRGRMAVFEFFEMSAEAERIILDNPVESRLWEVARARGMLTMQEDAMLKAFAKQIPYSEVVALNSLLVVEGDEAKAQKKVTVDTSDTTAVSVEDAGVSTTQEIINTKPVTL
jgi:type II secretory ATPase GspE/PulE/Tfp pilus assembly ATPase PilB-like protein